MLWVQVAWDFNLKGSKSNCRMCECEFLHSDLSYRSLWYHSLWATTRQAGGLWKSLWRKQSRWIWRQWRKSTSGWETPLFLWSEKKKRRNVQEHQDSKYIKVKFGKTFKPVNGGAVQQYRPTEGTQRRAVGTKAASFSDDAFLYLKRRKTSPSITIYLSNCSLCFRQPG